MSSPVFAVEVDPGELRFSAAHFITFNNTCENLHGHNFHVRVTARGGNTSDHFVVDFVRLTELCAQLCDELHDKVLVPTKSEQMTLERLGDDLVIRSFGKKFSLPGENCALLPIANTTAEMLAWYIGDRLLSSLRAEDCTGNLEELETAVEEADRQWGVCRLRLAAHE